MYTILELKPVGIYDEIFNCMKYWILIPGLVTNDKATFSASAVAHLGSHLMSTSVSQALKILSALT